MSLETLELQPVSYKRYFRCKNCFLLLVYTINLSLRTDLVDRPPIGTFYMKHALGHGEIIWGEERYSERDKVIPQSLIFYPVLQSYVL